MKRHAKIITILSSGLAAAALGAPAAAVTVTYGVNFSSTGNMALTGSDNQLSSDKFAITKSLSTAPTLTVTAQGWNATKGTGSAYTLTREYVGQYQGGLGVTTSANDVNGDYGLHQADNVGGTLGSSSVDFVLLTFSQAVTLSSLTRNSYGTPTGPNYATAYDNDFSYGSLAAAPTDGGSWATLPATIFNPTNSSGCAGSSCLNKTQSLSPTSVASTRWIVAASFVSNYGGDGNVDAFKLASINAFYEYPPPPITAVPEPATWAMTILGFGLIGGQLRRGRRTRGIAAA